MAMSKDWAEPDYSFDEDELTDSLVILGQLSLLFGKYANRDGAVEVLQGISTAQKAVSYVSHCLANLDKEGETEDGSETH